MRAVGAVKASILRTVRRGAPVSWAPEWMGLGNLLYQGLWAYEGASLGEPRFVLLPENRVGVIELFPRLREKRFLRRSHVPFTAQRVRPWENEERSTGRFAPPLLEDFIRDDLLPGSAVSPATDSYDDAIVVNVRRGDYYSVDRHRAQFGMNQEKYLRSALAEAVRTQGPVGRIVVISDGLDWCRDHVNDLLSEFAPVEYEDGDIAHDLKAIIHAKRLIITNSTFSYWGGYIGDVLNPGRQVIAPWFFSRTENGGRSHLLAPSWTVIEGDF